MSQRGKIIYRDRSRQINDFTGLVRHRGITPTDIDGVIDYNGVAFIYLEGKLKGAKMPTGQRLALEHICDSHAHAGSPCNVIEFIHEMQNPVDDIHVAQCEVVQVYATKTNWRKQSMTVIEYIDYFEAALKRSGYKI